MDGWNAPQWADFDASVMSDIDEYFDVVHEELESGYSGDLQSCPSTPEIKKGCPSPYKTPKKHSNETKAEIVSYIKSLQLKEGTKLTKDKLSITPRAYMLQKALRAARSSTPRAPKSASIQNERKNSEHSNNQTHVESAKAAETVQKIVEQLVPVTVEKVDVQSECETNEDEENTEQNSTLIASMEESTDQRNCNHPDIPVESETKLTNNEDLAKMTESRAKIEMSDEPDKKGISNSSTEKQPESVSLLQKNIKEAEELDKERVDKPVSKIQAEPQSKQTTLKTKGIVKSKPTVLTSHARRQSTSKYRRVSNKYVSLAEAVSKFQNGTPERFRSRKDGKTTNVAEPLRKVAQTRLKLTAAQSPLLRCKYRTRAVKVPTQEEREIQAIEELRKNRIKPNPIKPSVMNPPNKLKTTVQTKIIPKVDKSNDEPKKLETKSSTIPKPSNHNTMIPPSQPLKKMSSESKLQRKTLMPTSKSMERSESMPTRKTMNPPRSNKTNEPTKSSSSLTDHRTTTNIPKAPTKIDKPTAVTNRLPLKTTMPPPALPKSVGSKEKSLTESFSTSRKDTSILSTSMAHQSMRKHTPCKRIIPTVVSTEEGASIKDVEILHFGIPVGGESKKTTKIVPFSFDSRNKSAQTKSKVKSSQVNEEKKPKAFHARPVPSYIVKPSIPKVPSKPLVMPDAPFSFQERNEVLLRKKKEMFEQMLEKEKQARIFHARPAPHFKPVFVRGASAENLRNVEKGTLVKETRQRGLSQDALNENRENTEPNIQRANPTIPKLKIPLMTQNRKLQKIGAQ